MREAVLEKHRWVALADGLPDDAIRIVIKAIEIVDRMNYVVGMIANKEELKSVEENLEVLRLSVAIESLVNMVIAQTKLHGGNRMEVDQLVVEFRNLVEEVQQAQKSGSFASTPKGTAEYIVTIVNILERVYNILYTAKELWMREIGAEKVPRKKIKEDVEDNVRQYFDLLLPAAREINMAVGMDIPKVDPQLLLMKFAYYALVAPQIYIPKRAYASIVSKLLMEKKYQHIRLALSRYVEQEYTPYSFTAIQDSKTGYSMSMAIETTRAEFNLYWQYAIEAYLDSLDLDAIFKKAAQYTKEEIELTLTALRDQQNVDKFWNIFVNVTLKSVGIHVEITEEEQQKKGKSKKKKDENVVIDTEIPSDVEQELAELFGGM